MGKLDGKIAFVSGTSPNIGGGIAEGMADEGAKVACVDINLDYARACAASIEKRGGQAVGIACDVSQEDQVIAAVQQAKAAFGGIDILVNGARFHVEKRYGVLEEPLEQWNKEIAVLLTGAFLCTQQVSRIMVEQGRGGNIISIVSTEGHQGNPGNIAYGTAKAGLLNFTRAAAMELARYNIRVNSLTPTSTDPSEGFERAERWQVGWGSGGATAPTTTDQRQPGQGFREQHRRLTPLQKLPVSEDYAKAIVFLASEDARMITGFDLRIDGGNIGKYWGWLPPELE